MYLFSYSAGAGRTGTFCALSTVLERVKAEGILDVFQTVKSLRLQRPHMVQTLVCCPAYLSMPPHHLHPFSVRASSGGKLFRGVHLVVKDCVTTDSSFPKVPQTDRMSFERQEINGGIVPHQ